MPGSTESPAGHEAQIVLSFDFEDWHQLVQRRLRLESWDRAHPALARQMRAIFALLEELGAQATFFVLGMTARNHPELVQEIASRGHEIACHGNAHQPIYAQDRDSFGEDVQASCDLIERICGRRPLGFRAPAFSLNRETLWAFDVLAELGFRYDSSLYDSPRIPKRLTSYPNHPHRLQLAEGELWEYPIAVLRLGGRAVPIGGGSYWRLVPGALIVRMLTRLNASNPSPVIYFHPYELDPERLRVERVPSMGPRQSLRAAAREAWRNAGHGRIPGMIRAAADRFRFVSYEEIHEQSVERFGARSHPLPRSGDVV